MLASSMRASADSTAVVQDCTQQPGRCSDRVDRVSVCASVGARECSCMCVCVRACVMCVCACVMPACAICVCHVLSAYVWGVWSGGGGGGGRKGGAGVYLQATLVVFLRRAFSIAGILSQFGIAGLQP